MKFKLKSTFSPAGDQPAAIEKISSGIARGMKYQTLVGVTGSGKTYTMANVIEKVNRPTLVISHNKTLAAQLYHEFKTFFPENAVEYFVSYYDYYQPEAYMPQSDTYIEKDSMINEEIEKLRHSATQALSERRDVIIVASVSCIYGLGSSKLYRELAVTLKPAMHFGVEQLIHKLIDINYTRNDFELSRGTFEVKGDVLTIFPVYSDEFVRIEFFDEDIERIAILDPVTRSEKRVISEFIKIYPATHYTFTGDILNETIFNIRKELDERLKYFKDNNLLLEAERLKRRINYDLEMLENMHYVKGIENYSRYLTQRAPGSEPDVLIDYMPQDSLIFIDESHVTIPQVRAMYNGDFSRKKNLVDFGFRLPSAFDNRPLKFDEFMGKINQALFVSATPADFEIKLSREAGQIVEQIVRPTGLIDPEVQVKPVRGQVDDLLTEITRTVKKGYRVLVTTLTKKMAEDLTQYYEELDVKVKYLHSNIDTLQRIEIINELRLGEIDVLIGVNLLREGLDLPEVALVAILDADKEGFLRSYTSLIQTFGRAARNLDGRVIMYADNMTGSMKHALDETARRREIQMEFNAQHNIIPKSIKKSIRTQMFDKLEELNKYGKKEVKITKAEDLENLMKQLNKQMLEHARNLEFEQAAQLRDEIKKLKEIYIEFTEIK